MPGTEYGHDGADDSIHDVFHASDLMVIYVLFSSLHMKSDPAIKLTSGTRSGIASERTWKAAQ
jgi:hypothetical protein